MPTVDITLSMDQTIELLRAARGNSMENCLIAFGTYRKGVSAPQTLMLSEMVDSYEIQVGAFAQALKRLGVRIEVVVLVTNGVAETDHTRRMDIVLGMTRGGDYKQVIYDHGTDSVLRSEVILEKDQRVCAACFLAQAVYKPELDKAAKWN